MPKHFEFLWEEAEVIASRTLPFQPDTDEMYWSELHQYLQKLHQLTAESEDKEALFGEMLFRICLLSQKLNINAYTALREAIDDAKIAELDPDLSSDGFDG